MSNKLLEIKNISAEYRTDDGVSKVLNDVTLSLGNGETLGLVGETGAGKTTTALAIMGLLPKRTGFITNGSIEFAEEGNLLEKNEEIMKAIRGHRISMIFQDPMTSLNPVIRVGEQIKESFKVHMPDLSDEDMEKKVDEILEMVGIPAARKREYPHQFSGGMKQRVVIAMALSCEPQLLIADEPTTALDVTIQAQVLHMMDNLKKKLNTSMILITHDLGIVSQNCEKVAVMYAGSIIESGTAEEIFLNEDHHPYTIGLFGSIPDLKKQTRRLSPIDGLMPDPMDLPSGCVFHPRCPKCMEICKNEVPESVSMGGEHQIKCHLFKEVE
ncbi:MAG: ABC transporter ATP-binding protein [Firmicutes bacterium]|nr:ABC transporter ATP-binding protein [Bacillota bacterium]